MTAPTSPAEAVPIDPDAERDERHARALREMVEIGLEVLRDVGQQADPGLSYDRVTRALRLTMALEAKFAQDRKARERDDADRRRALSAAKKPATPLDERRRDVLRNVVPEMIKAHADREYLPGEKEVYDEAEELIDYELEDADVLNRPIVEVIGVICQALGVEPDWSLWDPAQWSGDEWGLTEAEIAAGRLVEKPRRLQFPPPDEDAANDQADRLEVAGTPRGP